ncbi:hypothetical protein A3206_05835 [Candidatus Methanomassiliicoccus intestinalis]|nr:MAG: hypothetical protein A3206_05835 [Candidatus Methanomassiliicoccus intestinalis]
MSKVSMENRYKYYYEQLDIRLKEAYDRIHFGLIDRNKYIYLNKNYNFCEIDNIISKIILDDPMIYDISHRSIKTNDGIIEIKIKYMFDNDKKTILDDQIVYKINEIYYSDIFNCTDDFSIEKSVHDWIIKNSVWHKEQSNDRIEESEYHSILGTLLYGRGVCSSIAHTTCLLLNSYGVDCASITGNNHQWNIVKLDDVWYHLDVTYDFNNNYQYFNIDNKTCFLDHECEQNVNCPSMAMNYYVKNRLIASNKYELDRAIIKHIDEDSFMVKILDLNMSDVRNIIMQLRDKYFDLKKYRYEYDEIQKMLILTRRGYTE